MIRVKKLSMCQFFGASACVFVAAGAVYAQEDTADGTDDETAQEGIEEVVVTGTHIKGADIAGLLPVTVIDSEDIDGMGVDSGDALMEMMPEQGQNFFNEEENISGGVNSARGDIGAFNLRNLGTGNTLVLLNGRRMVNAASFQTEAIGGSFVPVNTVNSNTIPVFGIERLELLKDGASAIYGADAVAGVVNTVLKDDIEGMRLRGRIGSYEHVARQTEEANFEWGTVFNGGRSNIAVMADYQLRDPISSQEDARWANADFRDRIPEGSQWAGDTRFRNSSAHGLYGQFDVISSVRRLDIRNTLTDTSGEFEVYPVGHSRCQWAINDQVCGAIDGQGVLRYNINEFRDLSSELARLNTFVFVNHELDNGMEAFSELMFYSSKSEMSRHPSYAFSTVKLRVGAENYYNPFGPCGSPNRLPESVIGNVPCSGLQLEIDNYRYAEVPRIVKNNGDVFRVLQGLRGSIGANWDFETAVLYSEAGRRDVTHNRVSNTKMSVALNDPTPAAYNPFSGGVNSNIERALVDVERKNQMTLLMADFKLANSNVYDLPAGAVGSLTGMELRRESFSDNRDPRLDGTVRFTDHQGDTFPFVSDVVNSSPTPDGEGKRTVTSIFQELYIPVHDDIDAQLAIRYENFSDVEDAVVGKIAAGWRVHDDVQLRGSYSGSFRAPNLVTVNEEIVARQNTRTDWACVYASVNGGDPDQDIVDCINSIQRSAEGSDQLKPETSKNFNVGVVYTPTAFAGELVDDLTLTVDYWRIDKTDTIGLFGEENHTVYDLMLRLEHGTGNCDAFEASPNVLRDPASEDVAAVYEAAGICPAGDIRRVADRYANLDKRSLSGVDLTVEFDLRTDIGLFKFQFLGAFLAEFDQEPGGQAAELVAAQESGLLPADIPVSGFADLIGQDGNQDYKYTILTSWRKDEFRAYLSQTTLGDFYQNSLTLADGTRYVIPAMTTWNGRVEYWHRGEHTETRYRVGVRNLLDERAPLADRYFGFFADAHRDYGRNFYFDVLLQFD